MSLYLGENKIADNTCSRNVGEIVASTIPLSDAGLHLLDGALISSAGSYAKFVNYIAGLVTDYPDLFTTEANWQSAVSTYGVCGKFVYDSTNNTVRLPKITGFTEGTTDVTALGDLVQAGLPNITGGMSPTGLASVSNTYGAFYNELNNTTDYSSGIREGYGVRWGFDASRSSSIYGNSSTVQPQSIKVLYYIVIASSITNELNLDVADMADKDFSNITSTGTSLASSWSMPSSRYIDLTLGASGSTYTAPANGWFCVGGYNSGAGTGSITIRTSFSRAISNATNIEWGCACVLPVKKADIVYIDYKNITDWMNKFFIYAEGEN